MNLLEVRTQFAKISGRYDLVNPSTFANSGADFYIEMGQKSLERRLNFTPTKAKVYQDLAVGTYRVQFKNCRAIQEVWVMNGTSRTQLVQLDEFALKAIHQKFVENMYTTPLSIADRGRPIYYYPTNRRRSPAEDDFLTLGVSDDSSTLQTYLDTVSPADPLYTGIIILPPTDEAYSIEIGGLFYDSKLAVDTDTNYWSTNHPDLLVMSSLRHLEIMYKGSKSASSWDALIEGEHS